MRPKPHLALALAALLALPLAAAAAEEKAAEKPASQAAGSAMKAHVDPATGQFVQKPAPGTKGPQAPAPATAYPAPKVERMSAKGGAKRVRLDDRFVMQMTETVGPDGKVSHTCTARHETAGQTPAPAKEHRHDR